MNFITMVQYNYFNELIHLNDAPSLNTQLIIGFATIYFRIFLNLDIFLCW